MLFQEINKIIAEVDKDGSGAIEFDEFFHIMTSKFVEVGIKEKLMEVFHIIDQDKNVSCWGFLHCDTSSV